MKTKLIFIAALAIFFGGFVIGQSQQKIVEKLVMVESRVAVCAPLLIPRNKQKYVSAQRDILSASIPLSALRVTK